MIPRTIQQCIVNSGTKSASVGFSDDWQNEVDRIVTAFPVPMNNPSRILFAIPFLRKYVAIVRIIEGKYRFLILDRRLYQIIPNPFEIDDRFPFNPAKPNDADAVEWPEEYLPHRKVTLLQEILKEGDGPLLLGAAQTLVDSGRVLLKRNLPDEEFFRDLWQFLPESCQRQTWPATFAESNELQFSIVAMPVIPDEKHPGYLDEEQVRDYPESRYERNLQVAIEMGDQHEVDKLLSRRSSSETLRMAFWMVMGAAIFSVLAKILLR